MDKHEFSTDGGKSWREVSEHTSIQFYMPGSIIFRIKPRTIKVNGFDVPEPMSEIPKIGQVIYIAFPSAMDFYQVSEWHDTDQQNRELQRGLVHTAKEAAIAHAKAMLGIDQNGGDE